MQKELKLLDHMRPRINERYERFSKIMREREARLKTQQQSSSDAAVSYEENHFDRQKARQVNAHEHKDFAARLAHREHSRRAAAASQAPTSSAPPEGDDLQRRLQAIRARVEDREAVTAVARPPHVNRADSGYHYPSIPSNRVKPPSGAFDESSLTANHAQTSISPPALPPKPDYTRVQTSAPPVRPDKIPQAGLAPPPRPDTPADDRMFAATAQLENGTALRTIFLPSTLRTTFLRLAYKNTQANLETCGFLAGTLMKNAFFVSKLVVPSQTATSDTCEMTNESELFDYVDASDLMILGWIHTHPSQTCFMSSRDLHTHAGYQMMLAESVAVVCAPSKGDTLHGGDYGVFRLTDPPGKKVILNCQKPGVFHPHEVDNVYTDALRPGHVVEVQDMPFDVVDLR